MAEFRRGGGLLGALCCLSALELVRPSSSSPTMEVCVSPSSGSCAADAAPRGVDELLAHLFNRSYVVFRGAVRQEKVIRAVRAMENPRSSVGASPGGAQRVTEVLELDPVFAEMIAELPRDIVSIADTVLSEFWQVGSLHGHVIHPENRVLNQTERENKGRSALHSDFPYGHATKEFGGSLTSVPIQFPHTLQLIWILSPFTANSGSTLIYPGSHVSRTLLQDRWDPQVYKQFMENAVQVTGQPGDIILYIGQAWHLWGVNEAGYKRVAVLGQVLPFFFKHMESHVTKTPEYIVRRMPPLARQRLGFAKEAWFRHPKRLLPFPRSHLEGAECLLDMLITGYEGPMDLEGIIRTIGGIPPDIATLLVILSKMFFQLNRVCAVIFLLAPLVLWSCVRCGCRCCCCRCTCGKRCGLTSLSAALCHVFLLFLGMVAGVTLYMDRLAI